MSNQVTNIQRVYPQGLYVLAEIGGIREVYMVFGTILMIICKNWLFRKDLYGKVSEKWGKGVTSAREM